MLAASAGSAKTLVHLHQQEYSGLLDVSNIRHIWAALLRHPVCLTRFQSEDTYLALRDRSLGLVSLLCFGTIRGIVVRKPGRADGDNRVNNALNYASDQSISTYTAEESSMHRIWLRQRAELPFYHIHRT